MSKILLNQIIASEAKEGVSTVELAKLTGTGEAGGMGSQGSQNPEAKDGLTSNDEPFAEI